MKTNKFVEFDNEVQEKIKQCLIEDLLVTNPMLPKVQAKEIVYNTFAPDGLMNNGKYYIDEVDHVRRAPSGKENFLWEMLKNLHVLYLTKELNAGKEKKDTYSSFGFRIQAV